MTLPPGALPHRLILVRHGQTTHTAQWRISGAGYLPEPVLDEEGRRQADAAGRHLAQQGLAIDHVLVSPMLRARQTADAIMTHLEGTAALQVADSWSEAHFGDWEGMSVPDVVERYPGSWEAMLDDPALSPPGGESLVQVKQRVLGSWQEHVVPGRTSLVVTHLTPIRVAVAHVLNTPHSAFSRVVALPGSVTIIDRWPDGGAAVIALGERAEGVGPLVPPPETATRPTTPPSMPG